MKVAISNIDELIDFISGDATHVTLENLLINKRIRPGYIARENDIRFSLNAIKNHGHIPLQYTEQLKLAVKTHAPKLEEAKVSFVFATLIGLMENDEDLGDDPRLVMRVHANKVKLTVIDNHFNYIRLTLSPLNE